MKIVFIVLGLIFIISCNERAPKEKSTIPQKENDKIKVLNFGTFHMGFTSDAKTVEFDERNEKNKQEVHEIAKKILDFKPTVIVVETPPSYNPKLQKEYSEYLENPKMKFEHPTEIELLAYELGRLADVKNIYGIDHKMGYNYPLIDSLAQQMKEPIYLKYKENIDNLFGKEFETASTLEKLKTLNQDPNLDIFITINADIMSHISTENNFEGADEAAKYYKRNLRMYSNLNNIPLTKEDRVFILMGASHTAFFRDFMSRSPRYEMVNTFEYLD